MSARSPVPSGAVARGLRRRSSCQTALASACRCRSNSAQRALVLSDLTIHDAQVGQHVGVAGLQGQRSFIRIDGLEGLLRIEIGVAQFRPAGGVLRIGGKALFQMPDMLQLLTARVDRRGRLRRLFLCGGGSGRPRRGRDGARGGRLPFLPLEHVRKKIAQQQTAQQAYAAAKRARQAGNARRPRVGGRGDIARQGERDRKGRRGGRRAFGTGRRHALAGSGRSSGGGRRHVGGRTVRHCRNRFAADGRGCGVSRTGGTFPPCGILSFGTGHGCFLFSGNGASAPVDDAPFSRIFLEY